MNTEPQKESGFTADIIKLLTTPKMLLTHSLFAAAFLSWLYLLTGNLYDRPEETSGRPGMTSEHEKRDDGGRNAPLVVLFTPLSNNGNPDIRSEKNDHEPDKWTCTSFNEPIQIRVCTGHMDQPDISAAIEREN